LSQKDKFLQNGKITFKGGIKMKIFREELNKVLHNLYRLEEESWVLNNDEKELVKEKAKKAGFDVEGKEFEEVLGEIVNKFQAFNNTI
jgi:uncharacterized protein (UPF0335 family)